MSLNIEDTARSEYERWLENTKDDEHFRANLLKIQDNKEEITDAFYKHVGFGTSGMRGLLGPGTNRINKYVIRRAARGSLIIGGRRSPSQISNRLRFQEGF